MTNRRQFLQTGASLSSLPFAMNVPLAAESLSAPEKRIAIYKAVFDDRYAESRIFADVARRLGTAVRAIDRGDVTSFWYDELDLEWRKSPHAVAGMTQWGPMFVLERLAAERGMRLLVHIEHRLREDGTLAHDVTGPLDLAALAENLGRHGVDWPVLAALAMTHCSGDCRARVTRTLVTPGAATPTAAATGSAEQASDVETVIHYYTSARVRDGLGVPWDGPLSSWLIALHSGP